MAATLLDNHLSILSSLQRGSSVVVIPVSKGRLAPPLPGRSVPKPLTFTLSYPGEQLFRTDKLTTAWLLVNLIIDHGAKTEEAEGVSRC